MALLQRQPGADLVHHSDRGSEYASTSYQMVRREQNIQISMSKRGDCYDNAMIESVRRCVLFLLVGGTQPHKNEGE